MLFRRYWIASGIIGVYGFTRGFRATYHFDRNEKRYVQSTYLLGDRIVYAAMNGIMYTLPGWNIIALIRMMNRIEIYINDLDKTTFSFNYVEPFERACLETI